MFQYLLSVLVDFLCRWDTPSIICEIYIQNIQPNTSTHLPQLLHFLPICISVCSFAAYFFLHICDWYINFTSIYFAIFVNASNGERKKASIELLPLFLEFRSHKLWHILNQSTSFSTEISLFVCVWMPQWNTENCIARVVVCVKYVCSCECPNWLRVTLTIMQMCCRSFCMLTGVNYA